MKNVSNSDEDWTHTGRNNFEIICSRIIMLITISCINNNNDDGDDDDEIML